MRKRIIISFLAGFALGVSLTYFLNDCYCKARSDAAFAYALELLENDRKDMAVSAFNQAIGINDKNYKPYISLGKIYEDDGNPETALKYYRAALDICESEDSGDILVIAEKRLLEKRIRRVSEKYQPAEEQGSDNGAIPDI